MRRPATRRKSAATVKRAPRRNLLVLSRYTAADRRVRRTLKRRIHLARPLHRRIVLHPLSIMLLLMAGVLITGYTVHSAADSYTVTAKVPALPLTEGAVITDPSDSTSTKTSPITVSGTCPDDSYVTLTRNGVFSGSAGCTVDHTFSIVTSLSSGVNTLQAQDFNTTDDPGPTTSPITITYNPPAAGGGGSSSPISKPPTTTTSQPTSSTTPPLLLDSNYHFQAFPAGSTFTWAVVISGGTAPYHMHTDWGDKTASDTSYPQAGTVTVSHEYHQVGYFPIIIHITDHANNVVTLQLAAYIRAGNIIGSLSQTITPTPTGTGVQTVIDAITNSPHGWLVVAWPTYVVVILMAASFWLGERQALHQLIAKHLARTPSGHHHAHA